MTETPRPATAPEWAQGYLLSWSGKWHLPFGTGDRYSTESRTLCGTYAYTKDGALQYCRSLIGDIARGKRTAPMCKRCERSRQKRDKP